MFRGTFRVYIEQPNEFKRVMQKIRNIYRKINAAWQRRAPIHARAHSEEDPKTAPVQQIVHGFQINIIDNKLCFSGIES